MAPGDLADALQVLDLSEPEYLLFRPTGKRLGLRERFNDIPRYLFRISTPKSDGTTDKSWVRSKDARYNRPGNRVDILSRDHDKEVASMLNKHLRWWGKENDPDNLVSWTSSLLFALQYIFYRHFEPRDESTFDHISFCFIDTTRFPEGVFLRDLDLIHAYRLSDTELQNLKNLRTTGSYYFGEYLSQGALKIEGKCQIVSAQAIIDQGLTYLQPELRNFGWAKVVIHLREDFYQQTVEPQQITDEELQAAINIAQLFESSWRLPIAANFIALLPRRKKDDAILRAFRAAPFTDDERADCSPSKTKVMAYTTLPEVKQFEDIIRSVYNDFGLTKLKDHIEAANVHLRSAITIFENKGLEVEDLTLGSDQDLPLMFIDTDREEVLRWLDLIKFSSRSLRQTISTE